MQIQVEQTINKDILPLDTLQNRHGKVRTPKSRSRRASPYNHIAENPDYTGVEFVPEIPSQDYVNPLQLQTCENYEKYGGLYGSQLNMNFISDILPYQSFHRLTDEKLQYRFSDKNKMHAFGYQNGYHIADTSSPRLTHYGDSADSPSISPHFEYRNLNPCSRSSSRDMSFGTAQGYACPYSNRSESSVSDVDVVSEEVDKLNSNQKTKFDSIYDSPRVKDEKFGTIKTSMGLRNITSPQRESIQPSVIMRRSDYCTEVDKNDLEPASADGSHGNKDVLKCSNNSLYHTENTTCNKYSDVRAINDKNLNSQDIYSHCLRAACAYDSYSSNFENSTVGSNQRQYPVVPQAGYTSVIVDAQQYNLTNGFVH